MVAGRPADKPDSGHLANLRPNKKRNPDLSIAGKGTGYPEVYRNLFS